MKYVALLRGINVGGNTKVEMPRLKTCFESSGCMNVTTYINSGNVLFEDSRDMPAIVASVESEFMKMFNLEAKLLIRNQQQIAMLDARIPIEWKNDSEQKTDVIFLWDEINNVSILKKIHIKPTIEKIIYIDGALVWNIGRQNVTKGSGITLVKSDLYKKMTVRNINTVRKIHSLLSSM